MFLFSVMVNVRYEDSVVLKYVVRLPLTDAKLRTEMIRASCNLPGKLSKSGSLHRLRMLNKRFDTFVDVPLNFDYTTVRDMDEFCFDLHVVSLKFWPTSWNVSDAM